MRLRPAVLALSVSCLVAGSWPVTSRARQQVTPGAREILARMRDAYATCRTYRDSGMVEETQFDSDGDGYRVDQRPFATAFVRPDRLRFECGRRWQPTGARKIHDVFWRNGRELRVWRGNPPEAHEVFLPDVQTPDDLRLAFTAAVEVSGTSPCRNIPLTLLMAELNARVHPGARSSSSSNSVSPLLLLSVELGRHQFKELDRVERVDVVTLDRARCYRIRARVPKGELTLWIDATTFLVRRIVEKGQNRIETTTTFNPAIDEAIPDALLEFAPPARK